MPLALPLLLLFKDQRTKGAGLYSLLVFDWDGTLVDSVEKIVTSMHRASENQGLTRLSDAQVRDIIGLGLPEALQALYPELDAGGIEGMRREYSEQFVQAGSASSALFPGVREGLSHLREQGFELAVATGKSRRGLDRAMDEFDLRELFVCSRCADETRSKPHPQMLQEILDESGYEPSRVLMVGDTEYDLEMACNIAMPSVGVTYGVHSSARLLKHRPVRLVNAFVELRDWLKPSRESNHVD